MWIILVDVPLGPSKNAGFMKPGEAFGTALLEFNNNVFHSNKQVFMDWLSFISKIVNRQFASLYNSD